jgi:hypothetical protein
MRTPPNTISAAPLIDGIAHALIAAPGVGLALRIVGGHGGPLQGSAAGAYRIFCRDGSGGVFIDDSVWQIGAGFGILTRTWVIPEPGILLPTNQALNMFGLGPAGQQAVYVVYYYVDSV